MQSYTLGTVLGGRGKDIYKIAEENRGRRRKNKRTIYIHEKYANIWREISLHDTYGKQIS